MSTTTIAGERVQPPRTVPPADRLVVSIVIPCLNEEATIGECVRSACATLERDGIPGEVLGVDNGSTDASAALATAAGARVITEHRRGYGNAYLAGFAAAEGRYLVMADADLTYDFAEIPRFVAELEDGADLVMGDRMDNIQPGAMPWLHRYVGNPVLSRFLNLLYRTGVRDAHCGMRAVRADALPVLDLRSSGMEFASEMVIRAAKSDLDIRQFPIDYHPRGGESKLSTFRDGWRHLRFLLVHSPTYLFLIPGLAMLVLGAIIMAAVLAGVGVAGRTWDLHAMLAGSLLAILGAQIVMMGAAGRTFAVYFLDERDATFDRWRGRLRLEHGLLAGGAIGLLGIALCAFVVISWAGGGFGALGEERLVVLGATLVVIGAQVFFGSFLLSVLGLRRA